MLSDYAGEPEAEVVGGMQHNEVKVRERVGPPHTKVDATVTSKASTGFPFSKVRGIHYCYVGPAFLISAQ